MEERHEREQYFFSDQTLKDLADLTERYKNPCLLCSPSLGVEMHKRRKDVMTLDVDTRFAFLPKFRKWDIWRPAHLDEVFDFILVDPPFSIVTLDQLFKAIRILSKGDYSVPLVISNHQSRILDVESVFAPFGLRRTSYLPSYRTTASRVALFANLDICMGETDHAADCTITLAESSVKEDGSA